MSENVHFSPNQIKFIDWLATPKFERTPPTQELFASEIGVNPRTLHRWKQGNGLQDAVLERAKEMLHTELPEIYGALSREAIKGSYQHIRLALEVTGEFTEKSEQTITIGGKLVILPPKDNNT